MENKPYVSRGQSAQVVTEKKPGLWTRDFILICFSTLTTYIAFHSLIPTLPLYIQKFGGTDKETGLALAFLTVAAVVIRPIAGWALDGYGRRLILLFGLILFLVPSIIYIWQVPVYLLLFLRLVQGFGWGICSTAAGTVASDVVPAGRVGEGMGYFGLATSISLATAPAYGLWLIDKFSFTTLFMSCVVLTVISLVLAQPIRYSHQVGATGRAKPVFIEKTALRPALVILFVTVTYSSLLSFLALFARQQGKATAGLFFTTLAVTTLVTRPLSGVIVDKLGRRGYDLVILPGILAIAASMLVLAGTARPLHLLLGGILYGIGFGFIQPTMLALCISKVSPDKRGAANATYWTAFDIGVASGSVIWGLVVSAYGYAVMFGLNVIPAGLALAVYLFRRPRQT